MYCLDKDMCATATYVHVDKTPLTHVIVERGKNMKPSIEGTALAMCVRRVREMCVRVCMCEIECAF